MRASNGGGVRAKWRESMNYVSPRPSVSLPINTHLGKGDSPRAGECNYRARKMKLVAILSRESVEGNNDKEKEEKEREIAMTMRPGYNHLDPWAPLALLANTRGFRFGKRVCTL